MKVGKRKREIDRGWASKLCQLITTLPETQVGFGYERPEEKKKKVKWQLLRSINYRFHHDLTRLSNHCCENMLIRTHTRSHTQRHRHTVDEPQHLTAAFTHTNKPFDPS